MLTRCPMCTGHPQAKGYKGFSLCRRNAWAALNKLLEDKVVRAIGVSNYEANHLEDALVGHKPAVNQNEFHPYFRETDVVAQCKALGIHYQSYSPLGASDHMIVRFGIVVVANIYAGYGPLMVGL